MPCTTGNLGEGGDYTKATVTPFINSFNVDPQTKGGVNGIYFFGQNALLGLTAGFNNPGVKINASVDLHGPNGRLPGWTEFIQDILPDNGGVDGSPGGYVFQVGMNSLVANLVPLPKDQFPLVDTPPRPAQVWPDPKLPAYYYHSTAWKGGFVGGDEYSISDEDSPSTLYQKVSPPVPRPLTIAANGAPIVSRTIYNPPAGVNLLPNLQKVDSRLYFTDYLMWRFKGTSASLASTDWQVSFLASFVAINNRSGIDADLFYTVTDDDPNPARITPPPANKGILARPR